MVPDPAASLAQVVVPRLDTCGRVHPADIAIGVDGISA